MSSKRKNNRNVVQADLIMEYYKERPKRAIAHPEIVDWATSEYRKRTGRVFRDPDRAIRKLAQEGKLIKVSKGVYKYDPEYEHKRELEDFTEPQKKAILERDGYKCVVCGRGEKDGVELQVDHIRPKDFGGEAVIENGQTLCAKHNFMKKNYKQTETGKKMFIRLHELAKHHGDKGLEKFCGDVLKVYEKHNINSHIKWK